MRSYAHRPRERKSGGWRRGLLIAFGLVLGLVLLLFLVGSPLATSLVNRKLAALPTYSGHVDAVKLQLWRGAVEIENFVLDDRAHRDETPLVQAKRASLAIAWSPLWHGKIGGKALVENARVTMVKWEASLPKGEDKKEKKEEQKEKVEETKEKLNRWQDVLAESFPMEISSFEIRNGVVRFIDRTKQPQVDIALENLYVLATDLTNRPETKPGPMPARVEVQGTTTGNGKLHVTAQADPLSKQPRFALNFELREMELPAFNSFLLAYLDADVSRGTFELFVEVNAADGAYDGYLKPFFNDLDFKNPSDKDKNVAQRVKEKVVSAVSTVLKNDEEKKVATKAPFAGNFADNKVDVWTTIVNLLRNAFVQGLRGGFEGTPTPKASAK